MFLRFFRAESPGGDAGAGAGASAVLPGDQGAGGKADPSKSTGSTAGSDAGKGAAAPAEPKQPSTPEEWAAEVKAKDAEIAKLNERVKHKDKAYAGKLANERSNALRTPESEEGDKDRRKVVDKDGKVQADALVDATAERTAELAAIRAREERGTAEIAEFAERHGMKPQDLQTQVLDRIAAMHEGTLDINGQVELAQAVIKGLTAPEYVEQSNKLHYELGYAKAMEKLGRVTPDAISGGPAGGPAIPKADAAAAASGSWEERLQAMGKK